MKKDGGPWAWATVAAMFLVYFLERVKITLKKDLKILQILPRKRFLDSADHFPCFSVQCKASTIYQL